MRVETKAMQKKMDFPGEGDVSDARAPSAADGGDGDPAPGRDGRHGGPAPHRDQGAEVGVASPVKSRSRQACRGWCLRHPDLDRRVFFAFVRRRYTGLLSFRSNRGPWQDLQALDQRCEGVVPDAGPNHLVGDGRGRDRGAAVLTLATYSPCRSSRPQNPKPRTVGRRVGVAPRSPARHFEVSAATP